ncbi:hypothetical protein [Rossellomorea sp. NS-SX7]|uniref:hypothetical protein n=1 Tax=Rossellomorea sp. NS-SX7 TaxID=3463856 RepID=UPI00405A0109
MFNDETGIWFDEEEKTAFIMLFHNSSEDQKKIRELMSSKGWHCHNDWFQPGKEISRTLDYYVIDTFKEKYPSIYINKKMMHPSPAWSIWVYYSTLSKSFSSKQEAEREIEDIKVSHSTIVVSTNFNYINYEKDFANKEYRRNVY